MTQSSELEVPGDGANGISKLSDHAADLALARAVLAGSAGAWQVFLERYSGLLWTVIRRHSHSRDFDDVRTLYVKVIEALYRRKLASYQGMSSLATWLVLVTRSEVLDDLRTRFGRRKPSKALRSLSPLDREIFRLYYVDARRLGEVLAWLLQRDSGWTLQRLVVALRKIESRVDDRTLRRLAYDQHAKSTGVTSGRLLAYLDFVRDEFQLDEGARSPEYQLLERESGRVRERLRDLIASMPDEEQRALTLRFERRWSARQIADELGLPGPRSAFTLLERIVRGLRRKLAGAEESS